MTFRDGFLLGVDDIPICILSIHVEEREENVFFEIFYSCQSF